MTPLIFAGCFGWLHRPLRASDTAVLLCPGISQDACTGRRSYRQLADQLAARGYPTLRFDYLGTGDSGELSDEDGDHWTAWLANVQAAADRVLAETGARRLIFVGLRLGATLAAMGAARRRDVRGLVLLAPVLRGKSYAGQLEMEARLRAEAQGVSPPADGGLVLAELRLNAEALSHIRAVNILDMEVRRDCPILVCFRGETPVLAAFARRWEERGAGLSRSDFAGLDALLRPTHHTDEPDADFSPVLDWVVSNAPREASLPTIPAREVPVALAGPGWVETARRFGPRRHLAGILCEPSGRDRDGMAVIIANSGGNPHHGFARFSVALARSLARAGFASLRLDFAGLGDSRRADGGEGPSDVFATDRTGDLREAADELARLGYRRFAAHGLCSGAYHALHAGIADSRIECLLLVNLPWFTIRHERAGPASFARTRMDALARRGARVHLLFSEGDPGLVAVDRHFGPSRGVPGGVVAVTPGWDHELTGEAMQLSAARAMLDFLRNGRAVSPVRMFAAT